MCVFSCERNLEKVRPSLVDIVKRGAVCDLYRLAPTLISLFNDCVEVEFLTGGHTCLNGSEDGEDGEDEEDEVDLSDLPPKGGKVLEIKPYPQDPTVGASIGDPKSGRWQYHDKLSYAAKDYWSQEYQINAMSQIHR